jgi:spermidine/putrescine transport system ATP-binding protein
VGEDQTVSIEPGAAIQLEDISKSFGAIKAVDDVSLSIADGAFVSLLGPSGCGKTTLLRIIAGFERPDAGQVVVHGRDITSLPPEKRPMNLVFQRGALFPHMSVARNIGYSLKTRGLRREEIDKRVGDALSLVRLPDMGERMPSQLSGGQAQRVALARALVAEPSVLLLDEPLAALDLKLRKEMQLELRRIQQTLGRTFLYVTHDQEEALVMSDRIVVMNEGGFVEDGTPEQVYSRPTSLFASGFIGETNHLSGRLNATDGQLGTVTLDGGFVTIGTLPPAAIAAGSQVVVTLRPEQIALVSKETAVPRGLSGTSAVVLEVVYVGSRTRVRSQIPNGLELWAEVPPSTAPAVGEEVGVRWSVTDALILMD